MIGSSQAEARASGRGAFRSGIGVAIAAAFLTLWATIVRDDGTGIGYFMVILAVGIGWFAAWFRPAGMARTMLGIAIMQVLLGMLIATAPVTAARTDGPTNALLFNAFFAALWLISANFFRIASK
jgi:predicted membrane channel-forming protein YqfA (hemolysin III family)